MSGFGVFPGRSPKRGQSGAYGRGGDRRRSGRVHGCRPAGRCGRRQCSCASLLEADTAGGRVLIRSDDDLDPMRTSYPTASSGIGTRATMLLDLQLTDSRKRLMCVTTEIRLTSCTVRKLRLQRRRLCGGTGRRTWARDAFLGIHGRDAGAAPCGRPAMWRQRRVSERGPPWWTVLRTRRRSLLRRN